MSIINRLSVFFAFFALILTTNTSVSAQEEATSLGIEEIIVTARKREESLQDVPIAITAITEALNDSTIRTVADLSGFAPNVVISAGLGTRGRGSAISLRGINSNESDKSFDPKISVEIDGITIGTNSGQIIENFDLERVEILRGPQGTLFGKNTNGGVIRVMRTRPTGEFGGKVQVDIGEWGQKEFRALINAPIVEDILAVKVFATSIKSDGYLYNTFLETDVPAKDYMNTGATFLWTPNDKFEALFTMETFDDSSDLGAWTNQNADTSRICTSFDPTDIATGLPKTGAALTLSQSFNPNGYPTCKKFDTGSSDTTTSADNTNKGQFDTDAYSLKMTYDLNENQSITYIGGFREEYESTDWEYDATAMDYINIYADNYYEQESHELRLETNFDNATLTTGLYVWESTYHQDWITQGQFWSTLVPPSLFQACLAGGLGAIRCDPGATELGSSYVQKLLQEQLTESTALFANLDYQATDKLMVTVGLRYTEEEKTFTAGQSYLAPKARQFVNNFAAVGIDVLSKKYDEVSGKIGLSYQASDDVMYYGSISKGFQSGGFFGRNQNLKDFSNTYDPEFATTTEIGVKSFLMGRRIQLNAALFRNEFEDMQQQTIKQDPTTLTVVTVIDNVAGIIFTGLEIEVLALVNENFEVFANLGLLDSEYDGFIADLDGAVGGYNPTNNDHLTPVNTPETTFSAGGTYTVPMGEGDLSVYAKYTYIADQETITTNQPRYYSYQGSYEKVDASITYSMDTYSIALSGKNLTDDITTVIRDVSGLMAYGNKSPGKSWTITLKAQF
jgi:iron complex outermembrane receptor protein